MNQRKQTEVTSSVSSPMQKKIYFKVVDLQQAKGPWKRLWREDYLPEIYIQIETVDSQPFEVVNCLERMVGILELRESGKGIK